MPLANALFEPIWNRNYIDQVQITVAEEVGVVAYAFSPLDLAPDPIPILGYLDDLILLPLGIMLVLCLIPPPVMDECRAKTQEIQAQGKPTNWIAASVIVLIWLVAAVWIARWIWSTPNS